MGNFFLNSEKQMFLFEKNPKKIFLLTKIFFFFKNNLFIFSQRSVSRCRNPSVNWSSNEGSIETMSIAISEMTEGLHQLVS